LALAGALQLDSSSTGSGGQAFLDRGTQVP
jgi:hypothetical protein